MIKTNEINAFFHNIDNVQVSEEIFDYIKTSVLNRDKIMIFYDGNSFSIKGESFKSLLIYEDDSFNYAYVKYILDKKDFKKTFNKLLNIKAKTTLKNLLKNEIIGFHNTIENSFNGRLPINFIDPLNVFKETNYFYKSTEIKYLENVPVLKNFIKTNDSALKKVFLNKISSNTQQNNIMDDQLAVLMIMLIFKDDNINLKKIGNFIFKNNELYPYNVNKSYSIVLNHLINQEQYEKYNPITIKIMQTVYNTFKIINNSEFSDGISNNRFYLDATQDFLEFYNKDSYLFLGITSKIKMDEDMNAIHINYYDHYIKKDVSHYSPKNIFISDNFIVEDEKSSVKSVYNAYPNAIYEINQQMYDILKINNDFLNDTKKSILYKNIYDVLEKIKLNNQLHLI